MEKKKSYITLVVYKYEVMTKPDDPTLTSYMFNIEQIIKCENMYPEAVAKVVTAFEYIFKEELEKITMDTVFLATIVAKDGLDKFELTEVKELSDAEVNALYLELEDG
jgi:hypothetical protein